MIGIRLLIDTSKCVACRACQVACQQWHSLPSEDTTFTGTYQNPPDVSGANLTVAKFFEVYDTKLNWLFFKDQCRHCENPFCLQRCPLNAIIRDATTGIVRIDPVKCDPSICHGAETKPCQVQCPYGIPEYKYVKDGSLVRTVMRKCDFCYDRFDYDFNHDPLNNPTWDTGSRKPACELTCPPGAILSGDADSILTEANNRVNYLKTDGFPDASVYPKQIDDPTHVIWVLTKIWSVYGL
ncbi:MAG: 4Fe-4S dicluster domain-containing protein [Nitrospirota bacterium]